MRSLSAGAITALSGASVPIVLLVQMDFSTVVRLASCSVDLSWGGYTWLGAGSLGSVEAVRDTAGDAQGLRFVLSGVPSANLSLALSQSARNKACVLRAAILNATTHAVEDASTVGTYVLDQLTISESGNTASIAVTAHPRARLFSRPKPLRYTDNDQQRLYTGDRALEYVVSQATHQDVWPAAAWGRK